MRLSRRFTGVMLVFALAGALAPTALAGKKTPPAAPAPTPAPVTAPTAPSTVAPGGSIASMVDIEALK